jgi:CubicO group peptidase (beta-lactamase class C family)
MHFFYFIPLFFSYACWGDSNGSTNLDIFPKDAWAVRTPSELDIDGTKLTKLFELAFEDTATQAVVLIKDGYLIGERYAEGFDEQSFGTSWSMAKSIYAALIGMSIDRGEISSLDDPVAKYVNAFADARRDITIRDLLYMTSGLDFPEHEHETMFFQNNHLQYALEVDISKEPGLVFEYNNVNSMLLGEILLQATGKGADELLEERIFKKLNIDKYSIWRDSAGNVMSYCCIDMSARDFSRFGLLFARDGSWENEQIISKAFVDETFTQIWSEIPSNTINQQRGYGMHWWISRNNKDAVIFNASGKFGQYIFVDRERDIVFTRITRYYATGANVQDWGRLKLISWIEDVTLFRKIAEFLAKTGLVNANTDIATPITFEDGVSNEFFLNYDSIIDALIEVSSKAN